MTKVPNTKTDEEIKEFITHMKDIPRTGLHNPFFNKERYLMLGEVNRKVVEAFSDQEVWDFFVKALMRSTGKSHG